MSLIEEKQRLYQHKLKEQHRKPKSERISDNKLKDLKKRIDTLNRWHKQDRG